MLKLVSNAKISNNEYDIMMQVLEGGKQMAIGLTVLNQVLMMFSLMLVGFVLYRKGLLNENGTQQMSTILLQVCTPALIITSFNIKFDMEILAEIGIAFGLALSSILLGLLIARLIYRREHRIAQFAVAFSNVGFFGIPLVTGLLGLQYVIYLSAYILAFNLLSWTVGIYLITGDKSAMKFTTFFKTPAFIGMMIGFIVFLSPIKLSGFLQQSLASLGSINTPLAMLVLGTYLAKSKLIEIFRNKQVYPIAFYRLVLIPTIALFVLSALTMIRPEVRMVVLIASSAPSATILAIFSQRFGHDYAYGAQIISFTNLMCLLTIPIILTTAYTLWF